MGKAMIHRRLELKGEDAAAWFSARGWEVLSTGSNVLHLFADELVTNTVSVRRVWHSPAMIGRHPLSRGSGSPLTHALLFQVNNQLQVTAGGGTSELRKFGTAVIPLFAPVRFQATRATARIEIEIGMPVDAEGPTLGVLHAVHEPLQTWHVATSLVNAVLNSDVAVQDPSFASIRSSLESVALSVVAETHAAARPGRPLRSDELYEDALRTIRDGSHEADFTVEELARRLLVSRRYLARVFAQRGNSPRTALREARVSHARRMLDLQGSKADLDQIAVIAGFSSPRALREALRASPTASPGNTGTSRKNSH